MGQMQGAEDVAEGHMARISTNNILIISRL